MKKVIRGLIMSVSALTVAFLAIAIPFRLFATIEGAQLRTIFLTEIAIYFICAMFFLVSRERKKVKKQKEVVKRIERREKFQRAQEDYYSLAA